LPITAIRAEYAELDGIPLSTAAWDTTSLLDLYEAPDVRGDNPTVPYRRGALAFRRITGPKAVTLPLVIYGDYDSTGAPHADPRAGLQANIDELKRLVLDQPRITSADGTRLLRHHLPDTTIRKALAQVVGNLGLTELAPTVVRAALDLTIPEGLMVGETVDTVTSAVASAGSFADVVVPNNGSTYQDRIVYTLTGGATTTVKLTNLTADPGGSVYLEFGGSVAAGVVIDTAAWTAIRSAVSVLGLITYSGFESWLPLLPGNNTIRIEPVASTAQLQAAHYPRFL
jgi:hypothetical protein